MLASQNNGTVSQRPKVRKRTIPDRGFMEYESRQIDCVHCFILVHQFCTGSFGRFYGFHPQNTKLNGIFVNHNNKRLFFTLNSKNSMNVGMISTIGYYY